MIENGILREYKGRGGKVIVPEGVTEIGFHAFSEERYYYDESPRAVTEVILPEGLTRIGELAFFLCKKLEKVVLPQSLTCIASGAFQDCAGLKELVIPDSVTEIRDRAFAGCTDLQVALPPKLTVIEEAAFRGCGLTSVVIPAGVTKVCKDAFKNCSKIKTAGPIGGGYDYEFPWTKVIPDNAFSGLKKLTMAVLPATVEKVKNNAFKDCKELRDVFMPKTAQVGKTSFVGCNKLGEIKEPGTEGAVAPAPAAKPSRKKKEPLPEFVIANGVLVKYNGKAAHVTIPDGVKVVGKESFAKHQQLLSVTFPACVESVEANAFAFCNNLEKITILGTIRKVGLEAFGSLYRRPELQKYLCTHIPIRAFVYFSGYPVRLFSENLEMCDRNSEIFRDNLRFIGTNLLQQAHAYSECYRALLTYGEVRHAILEADAIPAEDLEALVNQLRQDGQRDVLAEVLDYQNRLLQNPAVRKAEEARKEREEERALSGELSVADWRKIFKFVYEDGCAVVKELRTQADVITVPAQIGKKKVRAVDEGVFIFPAQEEMPRRTVVIAEGVEELRPGAFLCTQNAEVFIPSTVTVLPEGLFVDVDEITLHIAGADTELAEAMYWDGKTALDNLTGYMIGKAHGMLFKNRKAPFLAIHAPAGSPAQAYAQKHNIPFVAE